MPNFDWFYHDIATWNASIFRMKQDIDGWKKIINDEETLASPRIG